jgi:hypothetical protein
LAELSLRLQDGTEIRSFTDFEWRERFSDPIDTLSLRVVPARDQQQTALAKLRKGELCFTYIDGRVQSAMMIQTVDVSEGVGGITVSVEAVSPLKILAETTVDVARVSKALTADVPVLDFVHTIAEPFGFTEIQDTGDVGFLKVRTGVNPKSPATAGNAAKQKAARADYNETNLGFITRILSRLGCMLRCFTTGTGPVLCITAPHYDDDALYGVKMALSGKGPSECDPIFGDMHFISTNEDQYSKCTVVGASNDETSANKANQPKGFALTTDINADRPPFRASAAFPSKEIFYKDDSCTSASRAGPIAKHVLGRRAERAFQVTGTVRGLLSKTGRPWTVDTMCRAYSQRLQFDEVMWMAERTMRKSAGSSEQTSFTLIPKGYYVLGDVQQS